MKKKITSLILTLTLLSGSAAFAEKAPMTVKHSPARTPNAVYTEPYPENQYATVYSPWMRNLNLVSKAQIERGEFGGEACQQVRSAAQSPVDPGVMYFVTNTSGIWMTRNNGKHWYNCVNNSGGTDAIGLICDRFEAGTVYANQRGAGVQRSRDYGRTWETIIEDTMAKPKGNRDNNLATDAKGNLYMALSHGIYVMNRETEEITMLYDAKNQKGDATQFMARKIIVSPDGQDIYVTIVYQATLKSESGIYISHDGGKTWVIKLPETEEEYWHPLSIVFHPENPKELYFTAVYKNKADETKNRPCGLYRTTDDFENMEFLTHHGYENLAEGVTLSYKNFYYLEFGPKNPQGIYPLYYCAYQSTFPYRVSYDYGKTWERVIKPEHRVGEDTARYPKGNKQYTGYLAKAFIVDWSVPEGRIVEFECGPHEWLAETDTVNRLGGGFSGASIVHTATSKTGNIFFSTTDVGAFIMESGTYSENSYPTFLAYDNKKDTNESFKFTMAVYDPNDDKHITAFVGNNNGLKLYYGIRQSFDGGHNFQTVNPETRMDISPAPPYGNTRVLEYDREDDQTIYSTYHTSHDNGKTWQENEYAIFAISKTTCGKMLGAKGTGKATELYLSEDGGKTWRFVSKPGTAGGYFGIAFDADDRYVWYTEKRDLVKLDTKTGTWESYKGKFPTYPAFKYIAQNPRDSRHIVVASYPLVWPAKIADDPKLIESRDGGETWHAVPGLMGSAIHQPTFSENTDEIFVGTMSGMFIYKYKEYWKYLDNKITVEIDGKEADFSEMPVIENGRAMVPMRELFEALDANVYYDAETGEISARKGNNYVTMKAGSQSATLNGKEVTLDVAPYITAKGKTMVPIRFAAEALDVNVGWDSEDRIVGIYS